MVSFSPPPTAQGATTPIGVQTPSTTPRANRLRQPLESPFLSSPGTTSGLSDEQHSEIKVVFQIFDPTLSGYIDIPTFEIMVHSLGFRLTKDDIEQLVNTILEERQQQQNAPNNNANNRRLDLSMATQILYRVGYDKRDIENEIQMYFEIFDGGRKGFITLQDLRRVQNEVHSFKSMNVEDVINEETLQAMIEQFDENHDGVVDYDEFKQILKPIFS